MISRPEAGQFLEQFGLRPVAQDVWMGHQLIAGQLFQVFGHLKPEFIQVVIPLNLFTQCDQFPIYRFFSQVNGQIAVGKFTVGLTEDREPRGYPLVLLAEAPAGTEREYTTPEWLMVLLRMAFQLVEHYYVHIQGLHRQGCAGGHEPPERFSRGLLNRLRVFRGEGRSQGTG